jgi:predicted ATPase
MNTKNNWYVITGAPSSGKTTTLEYLGKKGYKIYYEWARIYIDEEIKKGRTIQEIRKHELSFHKKILDLKVDFEKKLDPAELAFMERGIPDSTAYMKMAGVENDKDLVAANKKCAYKKVFLMELIKYEKDYARTESQEEAMIIDSLLEKSYTDLGMEVIRVPKMSVEERAQFIIDNL